MTLTTPNLTTPPLESGDSLSRAEFERRYQAMSDIKKAELIEGVVYMASPLRYRITKKTGHSLTNFALCTLA